MYAKTINSRWLLSTIFLGHRLIDAYWSSQPFKQENERQVKNWDLREMTQQPMKVKKFFKTIIHIVLILITCQFIESRAF